MSEGSGGVRKGRNILRLIKRRNVNWIGHILRRNCLQKHVIEGKIEGRIEMTRRLGRRRKQLLDDLSETERYWKLKEDCLNASSVGCLTSVLCLPNCRRLCIYNY
jgi:hypothetical protein